MGDSKWQSLKDSVVLGSFIGATIFVIALTKMMVKLHGHRHPDDVTKQYGGQVTSFPPCC